VAVAAIGLLVSAPLIALIAVLVRAQLGSPVLFRQLRAGMNGEPFQIVKLRTMREPAYPGEPDADRTPPIGRLLRTTSLDELPQLWNVLRAEMSLIGPRPTLPEQVVHYTPTQRRRLEVRPGITGYAQVKGRNALSWPTRIEFDVWYVDHRSALLDLWILVLTAGKLLRPDGITGDGGVNPGFPVPSGDGGREAAERRSPARADDADEREQHDWKVPHVVD
jgi:lipopolysaccharide/colanic/teichoic acid biosynthesis glycosyltransferase